MAAVQGRSIFDDYCCRVRCAHVFYYFNHMHLESMCILTFFTLVLHAQGILELISSKQHEKLYETKFSLFTRHHMTYNDNAE